MFLRSIGHCSHPRLPVANDPILDGVSSRVEIAYVNHVEEIGGAELSLIDLLASLDRAQFEPFAIVPGGGALSRELERIGVATVACGWLRRLHRRGRLRQRARELVHLVRGSAAIAAIVRARKPAIVHANSTTAALFSLRAVRGLGSSLIWHVRDLVDPGRAGRWIARSASALVATSDAVERLAVGYAGAARTARIPSGIDTARFACARDWPCAPHEEGVELECLSVGQLVPWKGYGRLLEAAGIVRDRGRRVRFTVLGDDAHGDGEMGLSAWRHRAQTMGLEGHVRFLGHRGNVVPYLRAADALVHPAFPEPFGRAVVEAMAAGVPVICRGGDHGPAELVRDGIDGIHLGGADASELAAAILALAASPSRRREMGTAGSERARTCFDRRDTTALCERLYREL